MKPYISLCMIVKNEEKVLERCLQSVAHLVDEVVIVDTGSTDQTVEIAKRFTNHLYEFEWIHDFSAARNFAAEKATGKWILVLDADEYVEEENFKMFVEELQKDKDSFSTYAIKILNFTGERGERIIQNHHERVYRNDGTIEYTRKIHEQFHCKTGEKLQVKKSCLTIFHSGYLNHVVKEKDKNERNGKLLEEEMSAENNLAFDHFNLGNETFSKGDMEGALQHFVKAYELKTNYQLSWVSFSMVNIVNCLIRLKRYQNALLVIQDAEQLYATAPDFVYLKGEIYCARGQYEEAKKTFQHLLEHVSYYQHEIVSPDARELSPHRTLGDLYFKEKDYQKAIIHYMGVLNINKYCVHSLRQALTILVKFHSVDEIVSFILSKKLVDKNNLVQYGRICFDLGKPELVNPINRSIDQENILLGKLAGLKERLLTQDNSLQVSDFPLDILVGSGFLNVIDFMLLDLKFGNHPETAPVFTKLHEDENYHNLNLILTNKGNGRVSEALFIDALYVSICYQRNEYIKLLLGNLSNVDADITHKVANVLYNHDFKVDALNYYQQSNWELMTEDDYLNIIDCLLQVQNTESAIQIANYGVVKFPNDFRFYKVLVDHVHNESDLAFIRNEIEGKFGIQAKVHSI